MKQKKQEEKKGEGKNYLNKYYLLPSKDHTTPTQSTDPQLSLCPTVQPAAAAFKIDPCISEVV